MKYSLLFFLPALFLFSCDEESDICEDCQSAIAHMYENIDQNGCNPDYMENAMDRMVDDCGAVSARYFAGYMSHTCYFEGEKDVPECVAPDDEDILRTLESIDDTPFDLRMVSMDPDIDTLDVEISGQAFGHSYFYEMEPGDDRYVILDEYLSEGEEIDVIIFEHGTDNVILQESGTIRFGREGNWLAVRGISIVYVPLADNHQIAFDNW